MIKLHNGYQIVEIAHPILEYKKMQTCYGPLVVAVSVNNPAEFMFSGTVVFNPTFRDKEGTVGMFGKQNWWEDVTEIWRKKEMKVETLEEKVERLTKECDEAIAELEKSKQETEAEFWVSVRRNALGNLYVFDWHKKREMLLRSTGTVGLHKVKLKAVFEQEESK